METQVKVIHVHICIHHAFLIYIHVHVHRLLICVSTVQYLRVGRLWKDGAVSLSKYNGSELHFQTHSYKCLFLRGRARHNLSQNTRICREGCFLKGGSPPDGSVAEPLITFFSLYNIIYIFLMGSCYSSGLQDLHMAF